jgi:hypothetical protein
MLHGSVSICFCQIVESASVCTAIFGQCSAKPMGGSPHCLALPKINNRDWIFLKNVGHWIIVWEPWYADVGALWQILVFCTAHTRFWYLIHHCHSLITYRESYGVYFSKMGWVLQSPRFWSILPTPPHSWQRTNKSWAHCQHCSFLFTSVHIKRTASYLSTLQWPP